MDAETFANDAAALRSAPAETPAPAASSDVSEKVRDALIEALPNLAEAELVDLLEFVYTQHSGSNFNADNTSKAHATAVFVESRPFAISKRGVASLCKLARYSLEKSEGKPKENNAEHQLWLLMSGALNTAAAIADFDGDGTIDIVLGKSGDFGGDLSQLADSGRVASAEKISQAELRP